MAVAQQLGPETLLGEIDVGARRRLGGEKLGLLLQHHAPLLHCLPPRNAGVCPEMPATCVCPTAHPFTAAAAAAAHLLEKVRPLNEEAECSQHLGSARARSGLGDPHILVRCVPTSEVLHSEEARSKRVTLLRLPKRRFFLYSLHPATRTPQHSRLIPSRNMHDENKRNGQQLIKAKEKKGEKRKEVENMNYSRTGLGRAGWRRQSGCRRAR